MQYRRCDTIFQAVFGEIADQDVEAMALPTSTTLLMDKGITATVKKIAGDQVEDEAVKYAPADPGGVCVTGGGRLSVKYIFHCIMLGIDSTASPEYLRQCIGTVFFNAQQLNVQSIAFPALGATFTGLTPQKSTEIIISEAVAAVEGGVSVDKLLFVVCDPVIFSFFNRALKNSCFKLFPLKQSKRLKYLSIKTYFRLI